MKKLVIGLVAVFFLLVQVEETYAQFNRKGIKQGNKRMAGFRGKKSKFGKEKIYNAIGFSVNALNYYGDLAPSPSSFSTDISFTKPGFGISFTHRFGPRYSLMAQFLYGTVKGADSESADPGDMSNGIYRYKRNLSFSNSIKELSVVATFDLFENQSTYMSRVKWTPYAYLGIAVFMHNPQAIAPATDLTGAPLADAGNYVDLQPLGTEGQYSTLNATDVNYGNQPYSLFQFAIPFGLGARFRLTDVLDLAGEIGFRYTFTDYLDDVSKNYVDLTLLNSPLAQAMSYRTNELPGYPTDPRASGIPGVNVEAGYGMEHVDNKRGGSKDKDVYMVTSIRLTYIINARFHQAKFR
ncbi:MAG: hypothetical protein JNK10_06235 [Cyclobacteriaceae bacterium]|nr:hypothetical protein [Cyclobacteriaceae bacterium]